MFKKLKMELLLKAVEKLIEYFLTQIKPEDLAGIADKILDIPEKYAARTSNKLDDKFVNGITATIRAAFNIPDLPDDED